jgi:hypothetical protein
MGRGAAVALAAFAIAGCGGSSSLSSSQLHLRATRLCDAAWFVTDRIPTPATPAGAKTYLKRGISALRPELASLRALRPPSDLAQVYRVSIDSFADKLAALQQTVHQLDTGADPIVAMRSLARRLAPIEASENGAWQALQVPACVNK